MLKIKPKWLLLFLVLLLIALSTLFWQPILSRAIEYSFKSYCQKCLQTTLSSTSLERQHHSLIFERPQLAGQLSPDDVYLQAQQLIVSYEPHFASREIDLEVTLVDPTINLERIAPAIRTLYKGMQDEWGFFKINHKIKIHNGVFDLNESRKIHFVVDHDFIKDNRMHVEAHFNGLEDDNNSIQINFTKADPSQLLVDVECQALHCSLFKQAIEPMIPHMYDWEIGDGIINGKVTLSFVNGVRRSIDGNASLSQFSFAYNPLEVRGMIPEIHFCFSEKDHILSECMASEDIFLAFGNPDLPFLELTNLVGQVSFLTEDAAEVAFTGKCRHHNESFSLRLDGDSHLGDADQKFVNLNLVLSAPEREDVAIKLLTQWLEEQCYAAEIELKNFGSDEFHLFQEIMEAHSPFIKTVKMNHGSFNALLFAPIENSKFQKLNLISLEGADLSLHYLPLNLVSEIDHVVGKFNADLFAENVLSSLDGEITITNGVLRLEEEGFKSPIFTDVYTKLVLDQGLLRDSTLNGKFFGLTGDIHLNWFGDEEIAAFNFQGDTKELIALFPEITKNSFQNHFQEDSIAFQAIIKGKEKHKMIEGTVQVNNQKISQSNTIKFGFDLDNAANLLEANWVKKEWAIKKFSINNGWFIASQLPLEKFIAPVLYPEDEIQLTGFGDFFGTFSDKGIALNYNARDLSMENEDFSMEVKKVEGKTSGDGTELVARHAFDFSNGTSSGSMPVRNGSYFEKNSGLLFTDINGDFSFKDKHITSPQVDTFCNGIYFQAAIDLDHSPIGKGIFNVDIHTHVMKGKLSQLQHLFSHFHRPFFFLKLPLEANVGLRQEGGRLEFAFTPGNCEFKSHIQGTLSDGTMHSENFDVNVEDLSVDFEYNHQANDLHFSEIQGTLLVGKPDRFEEYTIAGDHVRFTDYANNKSEFDVWIGDKKRDILRIVGKTEAPKDRKDGDYVEFFLNHDLTHFGDVYFNDFKLIFKDWADVDTFKMQLGFKLNTLLHDLQRFSRTGFFFLSRGLLKELNAIKSASGDFLVNMDYDRDRSFLNYRFSGENIAVDSHAFKTFLLKGQKVHHTWALEHFQLDNLTAAADILHTDDAFKINFLGLRYGECLLMGLEGDYLKGENALRTKINLLEANLEQMEEFPLFKPFTAKFAPKGIVRAQGQLKVNADPESNSLKLDSLLTASTHAIELNGLKFQDASDIFFQYASDQGASFKNLKTALKSQQDDSILASLDIEKGNYTASDDAFSLEKMDFSIPSYKLGELADALKTVSEETSNAAFLDILRTIKRSGFVKGTLNVDFALPRYALRLALKEDRYTFFNKEHDLNNFVLEFDPCEFKLLTQYQYSQHPFWILLSSKSPTLDYGKLLISVTHPEQHNPSEDFSPLTCLWRNHPCTGHAIESIEGELCGLNAHLYRDPEMPLLNDRMNLVGEVALNMHHIRPLLPPELFAKVVEWEVGNGYLLNGRWILDGGNKESHEITYEGKLEGQNFEFKGYRFHRLDSEVKYSLAGINMTNVMVHDSCGMLQTDIIQIEPKHDDFWTLACPSIRISDFRPSLLRNVNAVIDPSAKPLVFRNAEITDLWGYVGSSETFVGQGWLSFVNPHKKNFQNTIFAIPAEIVTRIGLDFTLLTPVIGTVFYEIAKNKVNFTKFKDVYSEGKNSKFYLPINTNHQSSMDFNGNLHIQVRMKQYNVLFKIAELFTVSINGNIKKPTYSLQKQQKHEQAKNEE